MPRMEGGARRRYPRFQVAVPFDVTVVRPSAVIRLSGQAQDLGEGGLSGFISDVALPGERVELTVVLPGSLDPLNMRAVVRHEADLYCGFEFLSLDQPLRETLQQLAADPDLQASLINETEWDPGMEPPLQGEAELCPQCGEELPEEIAVCLGCGAPRWDEGAAEAESGLPSESAIAAQQSQSASGAPRRRFELDSLIAIIFLITLLIGLWEWFEAPAETSEDSQPSAVTVALKNAFLRPAPAKKHGAAPGSRAHAVVAEAGSLISAIVGGASPVTVQAAGAAPESAATKTRSQERPPSNSSSRNNGDAPESNGSSFSSALLSSSAPPNAKLADESNSGGTGASSPSGSNLAGMLLQKVLPVYPTQARRDGVQGEVVLKAIIAKDGTIVKLSPLQGPQSLTAAAMDAVQHWRFRPYELNGKPVQVETNIRLNFQLPKNK